MVDGVVLLLVAHTVREDEDAVEVIRIISARRAEAKEKKGAMSKPVVEHLVDPANPAPLTAEQRAELEALRAMAEEGIDTRDIPPLTEAFWRNAVRNPFYRPAKVSATIRQDADLTGEQDTRDH